jgi:hypothetical protein
MLNTPMLFCRLCLAPNNNATDECEICGTSNTMRTHLVRLVLEVEVNEFNNTEAVQRALAIANGDIMTYLVGLEAGLLDDEEDQCE